MSHQAEPADLSNGPLHRFSDWPNPDVPNGKAGVYTVWEAEKLIYVGMAGRAITRGGSQSAGGPKSGLRGRLASHASGRRSGDQFCIYVFDRLVLPTLTRDQIESAGKGRLSLDGLTRDYIRSNLCYRLTFTADAKAARDIERHIQQAGIMGQIPLLNPLASGRARSGPNAAATNSEPKPAADIRPTVGAAEEPVTSRAGALNDLPSSRPSTRTPRVVAHLPSW